MRDIQKFSLSLSEQLPEIASLELTRDVKLIDQ